VLVKLICDELNVTADDVLDFELCLADAVPSVSSSSQPYTSCLLSAYQLHVTINRHFAEPYVN